MWTIATRIDTHYCSQLNHDLTHIKDVYNNKLYSLSLVRCRSLEPIFSMTVVRFELKKTQLTLPDPFLKKTDLARWSFVAMTAEPIVASKGWSLVLQYHLSSSRSLQRHRTHYSTYDHKMRSRGKAHALTLSHLCSKAPHTSHAYQKHVDGHLKGVQAYKPNS